MTLLVRTKADETPVTVESHGIAGRDRTVSVNAVASEEPTAIVVAGCGHDRRGDGGLPTCWTVTLRKLVHAHICSFPMRGTASRSPSTIRIARGWSS